MVDELETLVINNVKSHLVSDAPLATLCSGGVDSSLISAIAAQHTQLDLYHSGVEGGGGEEEYAEIVSAHLGKNIIYEKMTAEKYWSAFPYLTYISDLPIYHPNDISLHCIALPAKRMLMESRSCYLVKVPMSCLVAILGTNGR
ncbi:asparagine synthase-related protein [Aeromonas veronii]